MTAGKIYHYYTALGHFSHLIKGIITMHTLFNQYSPDVTLDKDGDVQTVAHNHHSLSEAPWSRPVLQVQICLRFFEKYLAENKLNAKNRQSILTAIEDDRHQLDEYHDHELNRY